MLLKRQTPKAERIVLPRVRIQRFITEEIEGAPLVLVRTAARKQVHPAARRASILSRELIPDDLHLCDRFERRREALASATVVVVVQTVYRDVVGIRRAAGEGKISRFFGSRARARPIFSQIAGRERLFSHPAQS